MESCAAQNTPLEPPELVLVDSASDPEVALPDRFRERIRLVREEVSGLGRARARGIRETYGDVLIFADDDTIFPPDYQEKALRILSERPYLGAIGCQLLPEFEGPLVLPQHYYWERLALRRFTGDHWSNRWDDFATTPIGGGMVVRRFAAEEWARKFKHTPWRYELGRKGKSMSGAEDVDLTHTVCEMGYGKGVFEELKLTHIIPRERLTADFLVKITEGNARSWAFIRGMLDPVMRPPPRTIAHRIKILAEAWRRNRLDRALILAEDRGAYMGWRQVEEARVLFYA